MEQLAAPISLSLARTTEALVLLLALLYGAH
jgi:hypothetical protein